MIVPAMTLKEIKKSLMKDYETELRTKLILSKATRQRKWMLNGRKNFIETIYFETASKNNWRITIQGTQGNIHTMPYLISYGERGIRADHIPWELTPLTFMHFNTHFFQRYRERAQIPDSKPEELVKLFFKKNLFMIPCTGDNEGASQVFTPLFGGIGLGIYHEELDIFEFKTFVDNSLLKEEQLKKVYEIYEDTYKRILEALQKGK